MVSKRTLGLLFDLDGTCCESEKYHFETWCEIFESLKKPKLEIEEYNKNFAGYTNAQINQRLFPTWSESQREDFAEKKEEMFRAKAKRGGVGIVNGFKEFIDYISVNNKWSLFDDDGSEVILVPIIVTNAPPKNYAVMLESLGYSYVPNPSFPDYHPYPPFLDVFSAEERGGLDNGYKPFGRAAALHGLPVADCVVFEDSPSAIVAANVAKVKCIVGLVTTHSEEEVKAARPTMVVKDWRELQGLFPSSPLRLMKHLIGF